MVGSALAFLGLWWNFVSAEVVLERLDGVSKLDFGILGAWIFILRNDEVWVQYSVWKGISGFYSGVLCLVARFIKSSSRIQWTYSTFNYDTKLCRYAIALFRMRWNNCLSIRNQNCFTFTTCTIFH